MPFESRRSKLELTSKEKESLAKISKSRTESGRRIERSKMLLLYADSIPINAIAKRLVTNNKKVERCVDKALEFGVMTSLEDLPRKGKSPQITEDARTWFLSIACAKPMDFGLSYELWTYSLLANYIREHCEQAGHRSLSKLSKGTVSKLLSQSSIKPFKIAYYRERRDPDFDTKMAQVLLIYKQVELYHADKDSGEKVVFMSYDEKPGIQAIENTAADLPPDPKQGYVHWKRDAEYKRHGTMSLLAGIDLKSGKILAKVYDRHRSKEFVRYLKYLDVEFEKDWRIKIILDNHSAHISKETKAYLKSVPGRFEFIFTPKHASWLNIIEMFFSKMARSLLRGIRVKSKNELKQRIFQYLEQINKAPVVFKWKWKMDEVIV